MAFVLHIVVEDLKDIDLPPTDLDDTSLVMPSWHIYWNLAPFQVVATVL